MTVRHYAQRSTTQRSETRYNHMSWNMGTIIDFQLVVGIVVGKILFGAFCTSQLFRRLALSLAAVALCFLYCRGGSGSILDAAAAIRADLVVRPDFARGLALGVAGALTGFGLFRRLGRDRSQKS